MWIYTLSFLFGCWLCLQSANLPAWQPLMLLFTVAGVIRYLPGNRFSRLPRYLVCLAGSLLSLLAGMLAVLFVESDYPARQLPAEMIGQDVTVTGVITGMPVKKDADWRFDFRVHSTELERQPVTLPRNLRLAWYDTKAGRQILLKPGQVWCFTLRLKPIAATLNEGLFDYEAWLYRQQVGARGYVRAAHGRPAFDAFCLQCVIDRLRFELSANLDHFGESHALAIFRAISLGDRSGFDEALWQVMQSNGVNHLVAISGLHVTIVALLFYVIAGWCWRRSARLCRLVPAVQVQLLGGFIAALLYAMLAGFSVPTQRAMIMLSVLFLGRLLLKNPSWSLQLQVAALVVVLWDPLALLDAGMWLSFIAVFAIILASRGYISSNGLQSGIRTQWLVSLALIPASAFFFGRVSLISLPVNLWAIPLFSLFFIPAGLLMVLIASLQLEWLDDVVRLYLFLLDRVIDVFRWSAALDWSSYAFAGDRKDLLFLLVCPLLLALLPVKSMRWLSVTAFLLILAFKHPGLRADNRLRISLIDVGQGLSVLITIGELAMLYDAGPRFRNGSSATGRIVLPTLQYRGIHKLDALVISHSDSDHAGDYPKLVEQLDVRRIYHGEPEQIPAGNARQRCAWPAGWDWQDVEFRFLNQETLAKGNNNNSCVLRISRKGFSLLLTGDIERQLETQLLNNKDFKLKSTAVVIPHHGSSSSSTEAFVQAVDAEFVLNSSGFLNRWGFPDSRVRERWQQNGALFLDTAILGGIDLYIDEHGNLSRIRRQAKEQLRYWRWPREQGIR